MDILSEAGYDETVDDSRITSIRVAAKDTRMHAAFECAEDAAILNSTFLVLLISNRVVICFFPVHSFISVPILDLCDLGLL